MTASRVAVFATLSYLLVAGGHIYSGDGLIMLRVTEAMVERGEVSVRPIEGFEDYATLPGQDDKRYSKYGLGLSLAALPAYVLAGAVTDSIGEAALPAFERSGLIYYDTGQATEVLAAAGAVATNAVISGLVAGLFALVLLQLGASARAAMLAALVFALSGVAPFYAKTFFSEPLASLALMGTLAAVLAARTARKPLGFWLLAGLCLGSAVLTRVGLAAVLPVALLAAWLHHRDHPQLPLTHLMAAAAAGLALPLGILLAYNNARFGSAFETGYGAEASAFSGDATEGILGLLASPGRGLLWYWPWIVFAVPGLGLVWRQERSVSLLAGGTALVLLAMHAPWHMWEGGWCFGPRFLVPALPLLGLPAALWIIQNQERPAVRAIVGLVGVFSGGLALRSVQINYLDDHFALFQSFPDDFQWLMRWSVDWSPAIRYWTEPGGDFLIWPRLVAGEAGTALQALALTLAGAWAISALWLGRALVRGR